MTNKMSCGEVPCYMVNDLLPLFVDGLLSPESERDIRKHLDECKECRSIYRQMTEPESEIPKMNEELAEVDYLKKIKRGRKKLLIGALAIIAIIIVGAWTHAKIQATKAQISYDDATKTMVIYGKDDTDLTLPDTVNEAKELDAQFDNFHVKVHLPLLRTDSMKLDEYLPAYLGRTNESLKFIRNYLKENSTQIDLADRADKYVELSILPDGQYTWSEVEDRIELDIGSFYWHREELCILALMGNKSVQWKQLGYAWYLGTCIDPYSETAAAPFEDGLEREPYYEAYVKGGGTEEASPENYKILTDAISYICLTKGRNWGTAYECMPVYKTGVYQGPAKLLDPGNDMSVSMATSFIAYLSEKYGFDKVSGFCFNNDKFEDVFRTDWQSEYDSWAEWIMENYG